MVVIAGKGHETYQEIAGRRLPFDDVVEARRALSVAFPVGPGDLGRCAARPERPKAISPCSVWATREASRCG